MKLSTKGRYAMIALTDLAAQGPERLVSLSEIAERQDISLAYLEQLFVKLRRAEIVDSVRGPGGGYRLARPVGEVRISEILAAVDETMDALAAYIFFYPDVVVLDAGSDPETAREVFRHLDSIGAGPLLILVDEAQRQEWAGSAPPTARTRYLSPLLGGAAWAAAVQDLLAAGAARGEAEPALDGALARSG